MAIRVTEAEVKEIIKTSISDVIVLNSMITNASLIVDEDIEPTAGHSAERLKMIELYLAAHFVALSEERGGLIELELGDARDEMANVYGEGLKSTRYGQMALSADTSGLLQASTETAVKSARFTVV